MDRLEREAVRARLRAAAARHGYLFEEAPGPAEGFRALLTRPEGDREVFFVVVPEDGSWISLSLVLVVDEGFFRDHVEEILGVTSRYDVSPAPAREEGLGPGEIYLHLSLRIFRAGFTEEVLRLGVENLLAAREGLDAGFRDTGGEEYD